MKKGIVYGIVCACILLMYLYPHTMLSPGELAEGHQKLNDKCLDCHQPFWGIVNDKCIACHKLSEIGKDTLNMNHTITQKTKILFHAGLKDQSCTSCHTDHKGVKPDKSWNMFTHEILSPEMIGKCSSCHNKPTDNLHLRISSSCKNCHNTEGWKTNVAFNHDMIESVDKNNCTACHQKPNDSYHLYFNDNCDNCHGTNKWVPSTFDHASYFHLDTDHNVKCNTCHTNNVFNAFTCYGCHEHSESKIMEEHTEHGINNYTACTSCHKSANKHDIERSGDLKIGTPNQIREYIKSQEMKGRKEHDEKKEKDDD